MWLDKCTVPRVIYTSRCRLRIRANAQRKSYLIIMLHIMLCYAFMTRLCNIHCCITKENNPQMTDTWSHVIGSAVLSKVYESKSVMVQKLTMWLGCLQIWPCNVLLTLIASVNACTIWGSILRVRKCCKHRLSYAWKAAWRQYIGQRRRQWTHRKGRRGVNDCECWTERTKIINIMFTERKVGKRIPRIPLLAPRPAFTKANKDET